MFSNLLSYFLLALALSHGAWLINESEIFRGYREFAQKANRMWGYSTQCILCTSTQLALLTCWALPNYLFPKAWVGIDYLLSSLVLTKLTLLVHFVIDALAFRVRPSYWGSSVATEVEDPSFDVIEPETSAPEPFDSRD